MAEKDPRLKRAGVSGFNKPKRTPSNPKKSHIVVAKVGDKVKTIRFGEKGAKTAGKPKAGESDRMKAKRKSFKARHAKNIAKGKMSAAYWANKVKWQEQYMSLYRNINKRKKAGTSRSKKKSTISAKAYANMKAGFPNSKKNKAKKKRKSKK